MFHLCTLIATVSGLTDMVFISFLYKVDAVAKATHKQERVPHAVTKREGAIGFDLK